MAYYTRTYNPQPTTRVASTDLKNEFQAVENGLASAKTADGKAIRAPEATTALPSAASRALKVLSFDGSGNPRTTIAETDLAAAVTAASNAATSESNAATSESNAALSETAAAASAAAADASADAAAASAASIAGGPVASVNGRTGVVTGVQDTLVSGTTIKTINSTSLMGSGDISIATRTPVWTAITATGTYTVPSGVSSIRVYAVGKGGAGGYYRDTNCNASGGGGGGMAYGDIAVTAGQTVDITISAGVATVAIGGTTYLTANPGGNGTGNTGSTASAGGTGGTASKHASVTNGGAYSGGAGGSTTSSYQAAGGGSSGSPLGAGYASNHSGGGAGWGGTSGTGPSGSGGGGAGGAGGGVFPGGAGGAADSNNSQQGVGRSEFNRFTDILLYDCIAPGSVVPTIETSTGYQNIRGHLYAGPGGGGGGGGDGAASGNGGHGGKGGGGGGVLWTSGIRFAGNGGFGGGGGGCFSTSNKTCSGAGGNGGGGGGMAGPSVPLANANGGAAIVLIYA